MLAAASIGQGGDREGCRSIKKCKDAIEPADFSIADAKVFLHGADNNGDDLPIDEGDQRRQNQYKDDKPGIASGRIFWGGFHRRLNGYGLPMILSGLRTRYNAGSWGNWACRRIAGVAC